ncbi:hypothetical protein M9434_007056 [Picochlorum sp. BPE23]|nr:hypothetical protein M9434_007056 [Picochlorum sp. BPE23]
MCAELCTCFLADILRPNAEYCDIARKAVRSYRNSSKKHLMEKNGNDTKHSATGSPARKDKHHHDEQCCWFVTTTLLDLAANTERLKQKDQLNTITSTARLVYFTLYVHRDDGIPDLPSDLKSKLLIDM